MRPSRFVRTENNVYYLEAISAPRPTVEPEVAHHIFVVDRSGSMYSDIEKLKQSLEQAIAVDSYTTDTLTTLISFSTHGDVITHWEKVPSSKVMELSGPFIKELRGIRATFLTGISQALNLALEKVDLGQTTGITLFTDGYANSPSAYHENLNLDKFVAKASEAPALFFNAIGYRDWCDWPRMNAMTNALSGKTVKARSFADVLEAMKDTQALLAGGCSPALKVSNPEAGILMVAVNRTTGQVNGSYGDLTLRGIGKDDDIDIYAVRKGDKTYNIPKGVAVIPAEEASLFGALALAYVSQSDLRSAKDLLFASGNKSLWEEHQAAMTPSSLSVMVDDLQSWVKIGTNDSYEMGRNTRPKFNLFDLANAINAQPSRSIGLALDEFYQGYRRRSVKRLPGSREADGSVIAAKTELVPKGEGRVYIRAVEFNTSDASVQLATQRDMQLKRLADGEIVNEVQYIPLDKLQEFRTYTLVSSGERNVEKIPLEVYTKQAWNALREFLIPSEANQEFTPGKKIRIELKRFRMDTDDAPSTDTLLAAVGRLHEAQARVKALSAMQDKAEASPYTADQVAALSELHLTPALYFSAPTHTHYADKDEATKNGLIDSFTRYKINFGTKDILDTGEFKSGNAFLARRYEVTLNGAKVDKPKLDTYLQGASYSVKPPGRAKDTPADELMAKVFDEILLGSKMTNDQITAELKVQKAKAEEANDLLQSLVLEIGCTGLLPSDLAAATTRYEPEDYASKFDVKLKKAQTEGLFFVADNGLVVSVVPETSWYTVKTEAA